MIINLRTVIRIDNAIYRVISNCSDMVTLIKLDIEKIDLFQITLMALLDMIDMNEAEVVEDDAEIVIDIDSLPEHLKDKYHRVSKSVNMVLDAYKPDYMGLMSKKKKPVVRKAIEDCGLSKATFWKYCRRYLQSGFRMSALTDGRNNSDRSSGYTYKIKTGSKPQYIPGQGIIIDDNIKEIFDEAIEQYKKGRCKTIRSMYDRMNMIHFSTTEIVDGYETLVLLPASERPTERQFRYYFEKHLSKEEMDIIKTSQQEHRNNKRLLKSDVLYQVYGPGDMIEIDAVEADVSLVSSLDRTKSVGRPIVYFMIDVYTRCIIALSVDFDNNSMVGLTNLFLNLADDKVTYCGRFGIDLNTEWPSNFIPRRIRVDRGSDFKSKEFGRICNALGIEKQLVSGGSGSLKGVVEQSFRQMHLRQNEHLENYGLIEKRYDSKHHEEAILTIQEYTQMVINHVLYHNNKYMNNYPLTPEMIEKDIEPIPLNLWEYGVSKYGAPRPIGSINEYLFHLMTPVTASLSRSGIQYKGLTYMPNNDPKLIREMFKADKSKVKMEVRIDSRDIGYVYYLRDNDLIAAPLNPKLTGNAEYSGMTLKQYEDYRKARREMGTKGNLKNQQLSIDNHMINESIVKSAKTNRLTGLRADDSNMRPNREIEKQRVSSENAIASRLSDIEPLPQAEEKLEEKPKEKYRHFESFEEVLDAMREEL